MDHEINSSYDSESKYGQWADRQVVLAGGVFAPTDALAGSPEKQAVLEYRASHGLPLFHPGDSKEVKGFDGREAKTGPNLKLSARRMSVPKGKIALLHDHTFMSSLKDMEVVAREREFRWVVDRL
jgi:hypothetical protein